MPRGSTCVVGIALAIVLFTACSKPEPAADAGNGVCGDGMDNDGDGSTDYPADPGCDSVVDNDESNAPIAMCSDDRDNDGDDLIDYPADPGCYSPLQDSELDDCPTGPMCPPCSNNLDDDGDGLIDYPDDPGCLAASEPDEYEVNPIACGTGLTVTLLQGTRVTGTLPGSPSTLASTTCGGAGGEVPYQLSLTQTRILVARTDLPETTADTVLYLRRSCMDPATEVTCNDNSGAPGVTGSSITTTLEQGTYYLVVDARDAGAGGTFTLDALLLQAEGQPCAQQADCGPGLQCRIPEGETEMVCAQPNCTDPADADGDLLGAYPDDPGCDGLGDFDELDDCPSGPMCPLCGNDLDDDMDGFIDYPADPTCTSASSNLEALCPQETSPVTPITMPTHTGTTIGGANNFTPACSSSSAEDRLFSLGLPVPVATLTIDTETSAFDTILSFTDATCTSLQCDDDGGTGLQSLITRTNVAAGMYGIYVDGYLSNAGNYQLHVTGTVAAGTACTSALFASGVLLCPTGQTCTGGICQ